MKFSAVQTYFAARLGASTALASLLPVLVYDEDRDETAYETQLDTAIAERGVALEIGEPDASGGASPSGRTLLAGTCTIYAAESRTVAHTPRGQALVEAIVAAACDQSLPGSEPVKCVSIQSVKSERGYVLRIIDFSAPVQIG